MINLYDEKFNSYCAPVTQRTYHENEDNKYADEYGIRCSDGSVHTGELIGFRDDAPEEYLKDRAKWDEEGWA